MLSLISITVFLNNWPSFFVSAAASSTKAKGSAVIRASLMHLCTACSYWQVWFVLWNFQTLNDLRINMFLSIFERSLTLSTVRRWGRSAFTSLIIFTVTHQWKKAGRLTVFIRTSSEESPTIIKKPNDSNREVIRSGQTSSIISWVANRDREVEINISTLKAIFNSLWCKFWKGTNNNARRRCTIKIQPDKMFA